VTAKENQVLAHLPEGIKDVHPPSGRVEKNRIGAGEAGQGVEFGAWVTPDTGRNSTGKSAAALSLSSSPGSAELLVDARPGLHAAQFRQLSGACREGR